MQKKAVRESWITQFLKENDELLGVIVGLITSAIFIWKQIWGLRFITDTGFLVAIDILNITVLLISLAGIRGTFLNIESIEYRKLIERLGLKNETEGVQIRDRTNELVRQLVYCIRWFAIILCLFYLLQLFADTTQPSYEVLKHTINTTPSFIELLASGEPLDISACKFLAIEIFTNATNLFSAAFLFIAFQVLFVVTLENDNKTWMLKSYVPMSIAVILTVINVLFFVIGFPNSSLSNISHSMRLLGGIYNGVAMLLLFSRFISMEYFFQNSRESWQRSFYFLGIIIFLPLYVVAQPMYGIFNAVEVGQSAELFKSLVFLVCFWGKLVFLIFVYTVINKKWMHAYVFMVLSQKDTVKDVSNDLNDIQDLC